jgi:hypothetical protein
MYSLAEAIISFSLISFTFNSSLRFRKKLQGQGAQKRIRHTPDKLRTCRARRMPGTFS